MCSIGNDPHDEHREYLITPCRGGTCSGTAIVAPVVVPRFGPSRALYYEANGKLYAAKVQNGQQMFGEPRELLPISRFVPTRLQRTWI